PVQGTGLRSLPQLQRRRRTPPGSLHPIKCAQKKERCMSEKQIGLVGLGAMGMGMANSLRRAGYRVHVFDVRREVAEGFASEGGVVCGSPAELAAQCDVVISVVVNAAQTEAVLFGDRGAEAAMKAGNLFVMCSTVDPGW